MERGGGRDGEGKIDGEGRRKGERKEIHINGFREGQSHTSAL